MTTTSARQLHGQWNTVRHLVRDRWAHLTDEDLCVLEDDVEQFVSRIQQKTGEGREAIEAFLDGATASAREYAHRMSDRFREGFDSAEDLIRHSPGQSLAIAFGVGLAAGLVLGLMVGRR